MVEIRPQKTFLAVTINVNGEDVIQAVEVDKEKEAEGEGFNSRVQNAMQQYVNEKFQLAQGGVPLRSCLNNSKSVSFRPERAAWSGEILSFHS